MNDEVTQHTKELLHAPANTLIVTVPPNRSWSPSHRRCIFGASTAHGFDGLRSPLKLREGGFGRHHVQPKNTKMDVMCWECLTQAMDLPALVSSDVSFPSLDIIHLSGGAKHVLRCFKFLQFNNKIKRAFSEHERHIVSFINFKPTILQNMVCCCTNHSPYQPNNLITLAPDLSLDLDLNESMGSIFPICSGNYWYYWPW